MYVHGAAPQNCPGTKLPEMHSSLDIFLIFAPQGGKRDDELTHDIAVFILYFERREKEDLLLVYVVDP